MDIRAFTEQLNISLAEFARRVGVTPLTIYRIANNQQPPSAKLAKRIEEKSLGKISKRELRPDLFD